MKTDDRRAPGAPRVSFDGLVEVGGALGPSFEAQAVNVSEEGMQLRTTYLPELGQQITCRFETAPSEGVIGSGEVVWSRGAEKGGEFGIRFTDIDAESVEALKHVCGLSAGAAPAQPGAKVRLYIDGLASPMRAKIRETNPAAITVGSDLGFLQVGKQLDLEDATSGSKRPATIHRVEVAVDPTSHVPQLVVTLRYADLPPDGMPADLGRSPHLGPAGGITDLPADARESDDLAALEEASARMKGAFARQVARMGSALERLADRAKVTIAILAKRRRGEDETVPRRITAMPPGGGLHASGRRVVRGDASAPAEGPSASPRRSAHSIEGEPVKAKPWTTKRKGAVAGAVMVVAVVGAVAIKRSHHDGAPAEASPIAAEAPAGSVGAPVGTATGSSPTSSAPPANEPTPSPPGAGAPAPTSLATSEEAVDARKLDKKHARLTPFGNGPVHHGNVLHLRMDGPIDSIEGAQQPTGFTVKVPGRRSLEAAGPLAARDLRIASIKVNNELAGAELTVAFKDGVPNYQVSAKGSTLAIALAPLGPLEATVAKRDQKSDSNPKHGKRGRDVNPER